jgi:membrane carboxypeptidase/penicillin-binding protein
MLFVFIGLIVGGAMVLLAYYKFASDLPSISKLAEYKPLKVTKVYDRNGKLIGN